jgi:ABC-type nickel/cobalt efflux system permease component RcnA
MRRTLTVLAMLAAMAMAATIPAMANPFAPGSKPATEAQASAPAGLGAWVVDLQRRVNRELSQRMADAKGGSPAAVLIGAALCFLYGVFHAAGPGHGKVVTMSYFLGRDARPWRGVLMGSQIALTHVGGAIVLAIVATVAMSGAASPSLEDLRLVKLLSYAAVAGIGLWLLVDRLRGGNGAECRHDHGHHHAHAHGHRHHDGHDARGGLAAAVIAGAVPCTGAVLVLLYCIANGVPLLGLGFVLLIGLGMAATLAGFGLIGMFARRRTLAFAGAGGVATEARAAGWRRALDFIGPALILAVGTWLFIDAL